ncbi:MAG: DNA/RNA non-specific endonuclease [Prevotellaceae bacterium]|nr:DNA/RNA non-specific endonuclease [Prevotellaceae bacterium]
MKHKKTSLGGIFTLLIGTLIAMTAAQPSACAPSSANHTEKPPTIETTQQQTKNLPLEATKPIVDIPSPLTAKPIEGEIMLVREGYTSSYNPFTRQPNYVCWTLTTTRLNGNAKRDNVFREDPDLDDKIKSTLDDYKNSGFSRGHMCPAADNKWSKNAMRESFYLSNICPQTQSLNGGDWEDLESACRDWVEDRGITLHIVCGPLFDSDKPRRLKKHVAVPSGFFKAIICLDKGNEKGIAFIYQNNTDRSRPMSNYVCTIDSVEKLSGFDLFHNVAAKTQRRIERQANLNDWQ